MSIEHERMTRKFKPRRAKDVIAELGAMAARADNARAGVTIFSVVGIVVVIIAGIMLESANGSNDHTGGFFGLSVIVAVFIGIWGASGGRQHERLVAKLRAAQRLLELFGEELLPGKHATFFLDYSRFDEPRKQWWVGRSRYGNPKARYIDKWIRLEGTLADGTTIEVHQQSGIKTKSSNIMRERQRAFVILEPNPRRYNLARLRMPELKKQVKDSVREFVSNPEQIHVRPELESGRIKIKLVQEDADITPGELFALARAAMAHLAGGTFRAGVYR